MFRKPLSALVLAFLTLPSSVRASNCAGTTTGLIPIPQLGSGLYQGYQGGLYPGGSNLRPTPHTNAGIALASSIGPLDTLGNANVNGRVLLISIGMSNATQEFSHFVPKAMTYTARNPKLRVVDCAVGGQTAQLIRDPNYWYWKTVQERLTLNGSSLKQVQAVWFKDANANPTTGFPAAMVQLEDDFAEVVRVIHQKMPNAKLCYMTSRIYAGYASSTLNPEPYAYEAGFAVKGLIEQQLAGVDSLNFDPGHGPVEAPWLSWGPYLWADGLTPRSDGLTWQCSEFVTTDGTHPSDDGREKVADSLFAFFAHDQTTVPWFLGGNVASAPAGGRPLAFTVSPNPSRGEVAMTFVTRAGEPWRLEVLDATGRRVARLGSGSGTGSAVTLRWGGARDPAALYWARLTRGASVETRRIVRLESAGR